MSEPIPAQVVPRHGAPRHHFLNSVLLLFAVVGSAPPAVAAEVHVQGNVTWHTPWTASSGLVSAGATVPDGTFVNLSGPISIGGSGQDGSYELLVPENSQLGPLSVQISTCSYRPCAPGEPGATVEFLISGIQVGTSDLVLNSTMPNEYGYGTVDEVVSVNPGFAVTGGTVQLVSTDPATNSYYFALTSFNSNSFSVPVGVGLVALYVNADVYPCSSTFYEAPSLFSVTAGERSLRNTALSAPVANAGNDHPVMEGRVDTLDGSSSNCAQSYIWTQLAGPAVTLSDPSAQMPTFVAPLVGGNQTLTFKLVVQALGVSSEDTVNVSVSNINHAPFADAGPDQAVAEASLVSLNASLSYDPDGDELGYFWRQSAGKPVTLSDPFAKQPSFTAPLIPGGVGGSEVLKFALTASDGIDDGSDEVRVTIEQVNHPPAAVAGSDQTVREGQHVDLDGTPSSDPDSDPLTYTWRQLTGPAVNLGNPASPTLGFTAPPVPVAGATLIFELEVNDGAASAFSRTRINVLGNHTPPACQLAQPSVALLWPPNHKLVPVSILGVTGQDHDDVQITITRITADEPVSGLGDGDTSPDAIRQGSDFLLRAERSGTGNGRVYQVSFSATDRAGASCMGSILVGVPANMKPATSAVDDGQRQDATVR